MPWEITPLKEREERLRASIALRLGLEATPGITSNVGAISAETAAEIDDLHARLDYETRQVFAATADRDNLIRRGNRLGLPLRAATRARLSAEPSGRSGAVLPAGTLLRHASGQSYKTLGEVTLAQNPVSVTLEAEQAGPAGTLAPGSRLNPINPVDGLASLSVRAVENEGRAEENIEVYRQRILFRQAFPPMGGADADYAVWAAMIAGVTDVWIYPGEMGLRTVTVRIAAWDDPNGPVPSEALRKQVLDQINGHSNPVTGQLTGRPAGAEVFVPALRRKILDLDFSKLEPNSLGLRQDIAKSVTAMLRKRAKPGGRIYHSWITEAISHAVGEDHHALIAPAGDLVLALNELPVLGKINLNGVEQSLGANS